MKFDHAKVFDLLAAGIQQKNIAGQIGCSYGHLRTSLGKHVRAIGCRTVEQALAKHVRNRLKEEI